MTKDTKNHGRRVLVAEDSPTQAEYLRTLLERSGYEVELATDGKKALAACLKSPPALLVSDIVMPEMDGYDLCRRVKSHEAISKTPVILLSSFSDPADVLRALEAGADHFIPKPDADIALVEHVEELIVPLSETKKCQVASILVVEDSPVQAEQWRYLLTQKGFTISVAHNGHEALEALKHGRTDLVVSDIVMPEMDGYELCRRIKRDMALRDIPVLLLSSLTEKEEIIKGLEAGADAYVSKSQADDQLLDKINMLLKSSIRFSGDNQPEALNVRFQEQAYQIVSPRSRILNFLVATYGKACRQNQELKQAQLHLQRLNRDLEKRVDERTRQLTSANERLLIQKRAMEAADQGIFITDATRKGNPIIYANRNFIELTGYSIEEILGQNCRFLQGQDTDEQTKAGIEEAISNRKSFRGEVLNYRKDGTPFWNELTITPVFDDKGRLSNFIVLQNDVTQKKQLTARIHKNAQLMDGRNRVLQSTLIFETAEEIAQTYLSVARELTGSQFGFIWELNKSGHFSTLAVDATGWSDCGIPETDSVSMPNIMETFGLSDSVLKDGRSGIINDPASHPECVKPFERQREIDCFMRVSLNRKGSAIGAIVLANKKPCYEPDDLHMIESLSVAFIEALTRKREQQRLRQQFMRLNLLSQITRAIAERQDLESIFGVVLQQLEKQLTIDFSCICLFDAESDTFTLSSIGPKGLPLASRTGLKSGDVIPVDQNGLRKCVNGQTVYEPLIEQTEQPLLKSLSKAGLHSVFGAPLMVENNIQGIMLAASFSKEALTSVDCQFLRQLCEHIAIASQNTRLYENLQKAYDELRYTQKAMMEQERLRAMGQMASGLSHDINNALGPITLYTESLLETEDNLSDRARRYLKTIETAAEDIANTIGRMREFYRKREEQIDLLPVNLNALISQVAELTRPRWKNMPMERGVVVRLKALTQENISPLAGIETDIRDAMTNLIFNAVDAMPEGGTITIRTRMEGSRVVFEIIDTGTGMDEETRRCCLEPFYTKKGERGTGLGLSMVYGVMQRHKGQVEIESEPGIGTTVRLFFPVMDQSAPLPQPEMIEKTSPLHILCIDDDPLMREALKEALESQGHRVDLADSGSEGLKLLQTKNKDGDVFDLVITDLGMPYMDGREVAKNVKHESADTPVILLTGWGARLSVENALPENVDSVMSKPPKPSELRSLIGSLVTKSHWKE